MASKKKPSAAQLRARKLFAERARSGAFKRGARKKVATSGAKVKRRVTKAPSTKQLAARRKFGLAAKARAKAARTNSRGFSGKAPAWTRSKKAKRAKNPVRLTEAEAKRYAPKIKGLSLVGAAPAKRKRKAGRFKKPAKRALARAFSGGGLLGLGRSTKRVKANTSKRTTRARKIVRATRQRIMYRRQHGTPARSKVRGLPNPRGQHLPGLPTEYQRMYEDILASGASKRIAAATTMKAFEKANPRKLFRGLPKYFDTSFRGKGSKAKRRLGLKPHHDLPRSRRQKRGEKGYLSRLPNPSPASVFSEFRGKDVRSKTRSLAHGSGKLTVAQLGQLRELKLRGRTLPLGGKALLCADGRKRLHIGGVKVKVKGNSGGEVDMGEVLSVTYRSDKPHIESGTFDYVHKFGENGGKRPHLIVDAEGYPFFEGGSYKIDSDGIIN